MLAVLLAASVVIQAPQDAYADAAAADVVARARAARQRNERLVTSYQATVKQRIGVGVRALRRDRMLYGQELVARIDWQRDGPSRVEVQGARERIPIALRGDRVPDDIDDDVQWLVVDPSADYLRIAGDDADGFKHPLSNGSERDYRFSSGDTTTLTLPDNRTVRLLELQVRPRRADFNLMNGSLWFDADSYGLVRAIFAPARPFDIELDGDSGDADDVPAFLKPIRGEVRYVTLEYGLYEYRWWMMRYFAVDVEAQASVVRIPVRFERVYEGYHVQGGSEPVPGAKRPAGSVRQRTDSTGAPRDTLTRAERDSIRDAYVECVRQKTDSARAALEETRGRRGARIEVGTSGGRYRSMCRREHFWRDNDRWEVVVVMPDDTMSLLSSPELGPPILDMGDVMSENELRQLGRDLGAIPGEPWRYHPELPDGVGSILKNARYNRVEALSLGLSAKLDWGRLAADGLFRIGVADGEPNFELGLTKPGTSMSLRLGAYRRLDAANPDTKPFGFINSFNSFFLGRDDGEYFRTWGGQLTAANPNSGWWKARLYVEHQWDAKVETHVSIPNLFNDANQFRPNIVAARADQVGGSLTLRGNRVVSRVITVGADLTVDGGTGDFDFGRGALTTRATVTGPGPVIWGIEGAAGTSGGAPPLQSNFFIGGPATLRGYDGNAMNGTAFWRGRGEAGYGLPAVRLALFSDVGWAGDRDQFSKGQPLLSVGFGASFLDGILRMDLARRMRGQTGWRFDFYLDGVL